MDLQAVVVQADASPDSTVDGRAADYAAVRRLTGRRQLRMEFATVSMAKIFAIHAGIALSGAACAESLSAASRPMPAYR